jgi:hypothetical protein
MLHFCSIRFAAPGCINQRMRAQQLNSIYADGIYADISERLIRVHTKRRENAVELRVHYEITRVSGCISYRILAIDEPNTGTATD